MTFRILYQDPFLVAVDKPSGFHVHPPENTQHTLARSLNCLRLLRNQIGAYLYPVHRLDPATSGVVLFALQKESAHRLCEAFADRTIKKTYVTVTRGWTEPSQEVDYPLGDNDQSKPARTSFVRLAQIELNAPTGPYLTSRFSLLRVEPVTGRHHQIRRHLKHISHPIIGDTVYGNGEQNRFFRDALKIPGLLLKAYSLELSHPITSEPLRIHSRWTGQWHRVFDLFGLCPYSHCHVSEKRADVADMPLPLARLL